MPGVASTPDRPALRLETLGCWRLLEGPNEVPASISSHRRALALITVVAASGEAGVRRERVAATLWPDRPSDRASHELTRTIVETPRLLGGRDAFHLRGSSLHLDPTAVRADVVEFAAAAAAGRDEEAMACYAGAFLGESESFVSPAFARWAAARRARFQSLATDALSRLIDDAEERGDWTRAVCWRRRLVGLDPTAGPATIDLMRALAAS